MGANVATDVAQEQFCEATIGIYLYSLYYSIHHLNKYHFYHG